ncbi:MAG: ABC transporter permease [Thermomicrobiales bacterium]|nr:ABC transporter permease [Thermomicrobiales bacterium]
MATAVALPGAHTPLKSSERPQILRAWDLFSRNRLATAGLVFLLILGCAAIFAPWAAPYDPNAINLLPDQVLQPPSWAHPFGTDELGRDGFSRAIYGARISLAVGIIASLVAVSLGVLVGATAGMAGGWVDSFLMRSVDILLSVPLFFLIMISQIVFPSSIFTIMIIIGVASWMDISRLTRGEFLALRSSEFVSAANVVGMNPWRIAWRHILPNASGPIIVAATLRIAEAIILESTLSFIGLGIQPPHASLGSMLQKGLTRLLDAPWMVWFPGLLIALTVLAFNFVGDGIRDALDPKRLR